MSESTKTVPADNLPAIIQNEMVKRLLWSGVMAGVSALAAIAASKVAEAVWTKVFGEEPPGS